MPCCGSCQTTAAPPWPDPGWRCGWPAPDPDPSAVYPRQRPWCSSGHRLPGRPRQWPRSVRKLLQATTSHSTVVVAPWDRRWTLMRGWQGSKSGVGVRYLAPCWVSTACYVAQRSTQRQSIQMHMGSEAATGGIHVWLDSGGQCHCVCKILLKILDILVLFTING